MYNELYTAWKKEIDCDSLGGLPRDFYVRLADYLKHIREAPSQDNKSVKANLLECEAKNVGRMLEELLAARYKKLVQTMTDNQKTPIELLTIEEAKMSENFISFTGSYKRFTDDLLQVQIQIQEKTTGTSLQTETVTQTHTQKSPIVVKVINEPSHKRTVLRFIKNIPGIIGSDMKTYGPFIAEDIAALPADNAKMLVKQGLAVVVEVS